MAANKVILLNLHPAPNPFHEGHECGHKQCGGEHQGCAPEPHRMDGEDGSQEDVFLVCSPEQ